MKSKIVAIIPARGGSKRVPRKNIAMVAGVPLIYYTIKAALGAKFVDRVVVSTESPEIARIARDCGADVPFLRPAHLAQDNVTTVGAILHTLRWLDEQEGYRPEFFVLLLPTSPLRISADIDGVIQMAREKDADAVTSVCASEHQTVGMECLLDVNGRITQKTRRRLLYQATCPITYGPGGGTYYLRTATFKEARSVYPPGVFGYIMPTERSLDIDLPWHIYLADLVLRDIHRRPTGAGIRDDIS